MVPEGWKPEYVKDICSKVSVEIVIKPAQYYVDENQGIRAFRSANVREGRIGNEDWVYLSHEGNIKNSKSQLKAGDVLVVRSGYPGTACVLPEKYAGSNCIDIIFARPRKDIVIPEYLCAFTNSEQGRRQVLNTQGGLAQKHLNVNAYVKMRIPLPPLPEQKKIARILSTWDKAIETVGKLIKNSTQQKKALMQQLLTGKERLPGFSGEWKEVRLQDIAEILVSNVDKKSNVEETPVKLCNYTDVYYNEYITSEIEFMQATAKDSELHKFQLKNGDVIITKDSETPGDIAIPSLVNECVGNLVCGYHLAIIRPRPRLAFGEFLGALFSMPETRYYFYTLANGATRFGLNISSIQNAKFNIPSVDEQKAIAKRVRVLNNLIVNQKRHRDSMFSQKQALMQQLLTGKRRVKVAE
jgi:type I restriction enzyme S subunit